MAGELPVIPLDRFVDSLRVSLPPRASFEELADLTALRLAADGSYYASNYARGWLLYALVAARRPANVLEFGTGRGYGALCMARALVEHGLPGRVFTIDLVPHDREFPWAFRDETGARTERWSRRAFWERTFAPEWLERIVPVAGTTRAVMRAAGRHGIDGVELAFVDAGHDYAAARHDLLAAFGVSGPRFALLADDCADRPGYGVARAVRELFAGRFPVVLLPTEWDRGRVSGAMAWIDADGAEGVRSELRQTWERDRRRGAWRALFARR